MTETRSPSPSRWGITRVSNVVLPAPLHPARPITFILFSEGRRNRAMFCLRVLYIGEGTMSCYPAAYDEDRQSARPSDRPESRRSAADRTGRRDRPDRRDRRDQGPGRAPADTLSECAGDRQHDDDRRLSGIPGARLLAQSEHAEI